MFREVASGTKTDRAQLRKVLAQFNDDGMLMMAPLDRLARSTRDLLNTLAKVAPVSDVSEGLIIHAIDGLDFERLHEATVGSRPLSGTDLRS